MSSNRFYRRYFQLCSVCCTHTVVIRVICSVSPIANPIQPNCYRNRLTCFPSINFRNIISAPRPQSSHRRKDFKEWKPFSIYQKKWQGLQFISFRFSFSYMCERLYSFVLHFVSFESNVQRFGCFSSYYQKMLLFVAFSLKPDIFWTNQIHVFFFRKFSFFSISRRQNGIGQTFF